MHSATITCTACTHINHSICDANMLQSVGGKQFVCSTEVVHFSEFPLSEVPLSPGNAGNAGGADLCIGAPLEEWSGWWSTLSVGSSSSLLREALSLPDSLKNGPEREGGREGGRERERGRERKRERERKGGGREGGREGERERGRERKREGVKERERERKGGRERERERRKERERERKGGGGGC